jgi:hypothetical protein
MADLFTIALIFSTIRLSTPLILAAKDRVQLIRIRHIRREGFVQIIESEITLFLGQLDQLADARLNISSGCRDDQWRQHRRGLWLLRGGLRWPGRFRGLGRLARGTTSRPGVRFRRGARLWAAAGFAGCGTARARSILLARRTDR